MGRPPTAAASGTVTSSSSVPGRSASLSDFSVAAWLANGTLSTTSSASATASGFARPLTSAPGTSARTRSAASAARPASREPITTGTFACARRTARPKPRSPVAPTIVTGEGTAREYMDASALESRP